ncbi:MAG: LamG-like jellyroll fold domain-containing protein, partial [Myxococcota bacterium]
WFASVLRPEQVSHDIDGMPNLQQGAFSDFTLVQPFEAGENALAICEADNARAPYRCDVDGNDAVGGPYDCYDFWVLDSNAYPDEHNGLRRRRLRLWVESPRTANARVARSEWFGDREPLVAAGASLRGIEPTVTRDGKLLVWQGHPDNDGKIDVLMYATNDAPCGASGWDGPHVFAHMVNDPRVNGVYALGERPLRAADGETFRDREVTTIGGFELETRAADKLHGAYPWLFPEGEALIFTSVVVPCRGTENPPGCGPRRGGLAVIGYPTNWAVAHIDGAVNPTTDDQVRLFFSSPGPFTFPELPVTSGTDVWPFFGSNTQNYTEIVFDDGLDGQYAGLWHMNESVTRGGELDRTRSPDSSGYFNTATVHGAVFPAANNGPRGKALVFNGTNAWLEVPHSTSLNPVNGLTLEMTLRVDAAVDCDGQNNYRLLVSKGNIAIGAWSLILEESLHLNARVKVAGEQRSLWSTLPLEVGRWHDVAFDYDASSGSAHFFIDGVAAGESTFAPGVLDGSSHKLTIGGPGGERPACPAGDGNFSGAIEELRISRVARFAPASPSAPAGDNAGSDDDAGIADGATSSDGTDASPADRPSGSPSSGDDDAGSPSGGPTRGGDTTSDDSSSETGSPTIDDETMPSQQSPERGATVPAGGCAASRSSPPSDGVILGLLLLLGRAFGSRWRRR